MPFQLTLPSDEASPQGAPCDVPDNVRLGRPWGPRLAMLVSWTGRQATSLGRNSWRSTSGQRIGVGSQIVDRGSAAFSRLGLPTL